MTPVGYALLLTSLAGMATGLGSLMAFFVRSSRYRFLSVATGFSAGVMLYVSFVEILPQAGAHLADSLPPTWAGWVQVAAFLGGLVLMAMVDALIPSAGNPHEVHGEEERKPLRDAELALSVGASEVSQTPWGRDHGIAPRSLLRTGLFTALAIGIHNFPEGLVTFLTALENRSTGLAVAGAVALHNVPEGMSVAVPLFYALGNRRKAFVYSLLSGLSEPVGALVAYGLVLVSLGSGGTLPPGLAGVMLGAVAGIMVYVSVDELLPISRAYGKSHDSLAGFLAGMALMAVSLVLMGARG